MAAVIEQLRARHGPTTGAGGEGGSPDGGAIITKLSSIKSSPLDWLWMGRIPAGMVTVMDGDPGLGKSLLTLDTAARVSSGRPMPDEVGTRSARGAVVLSSEDDPARTIRPRLEVNGADLDRIALLNIRQSDGTLRDPTIGLDDLRAVEQAIGEVDAALLVVDPLMAYLPDGVNAHRDHEVRRALAPLAHLAARTGTAVLVVRHLTKDDATQNPVYRGGGSIGIIGAARAGLLVALDPDDPTGERRVLAATKANLAPLAPSLAFTVEIESGATVPRLVWHGATYHRAADLLGAQSRGNRHPSLAAAEALVLDLLADGPVAATAVRSEAQAAGVSWRSVERAKADLGVRSIRPHGFNGPWFWSLPDVHRHGDPYAATTAGLAWYGDAGGVHDLDAAPCAVEDDYPSSAWQVDEDMPVIPVSETS